MLYTFKANGHRAAHQRLGFWSINFHTCAVTWDAMTASIHDKPAGYTPALDEALAFFPPEVRAAVVQAALAAFESRTIFDIEAALQVGGGIRVRLIGGRGYGERDDGAELHGIIEELPPATPHRSDEPADPEQAHARSAHVARTTAQMQRIIDAVAMLGSAEAPRRERIAASAMIERILDSHIERKAEYSRAWVTVAEGIELEGDPREVELLLDNLVGNALKFSALRSSPRVRIAASSHGGRTIVHVSDNGVGLSPREAGDVFNAFARRSGPGFDGSGVGLAIARRVVERHGGLIWAEGEPGKGATFSFYL